MTRRIAAYLPTIVTFATIAFVGAAFIRLGMQQRDAQAQLATLQAADRAAGALERETRAIADGLRLAEAGGPAGSKAVEMTLLARQGKVELRRPEGAASVDPTDWIDAGGDGFSWIGPLRGPGGEPKLVARLPIAGSTTVVAAVVDIARLAQAAGLSQMPDRGFDFRLTTSAGARSTVLAASAPLMAREAVVREVNPGKGTWSLATGPAPASPTPGSTLILHTLIVLALATAGALAAREASHSRALIEADLARRSEKLRGTTQRLAEEVQQREALEKQFSHASFHDALTGLPNRRLLTNRLEMALQRARTGEARAPAFGIIDLERAGAIGGSLGLAIAEEVTAQAALRLEGAVEGAELVLGRLSDTGFAFVVANCEARDAVTAAATRLQQALLAAFNVAGHTIYLSSHAGIAFADSGYDHPGDLVRGAHVAVSRAKRERTPAVVFDPSSQDQVVSRHQIETDLHGVAERGELRLHYQPIVSLTSGEIVGVESLVRWQHPREGMIPPGVFIHLAEESGLICPITRWVLCEAVTQARAWRAEIPGAHPFYVSVNLSAHDMRQADLADYVETLLAEAQLPPGVLRLEVTEGSVIDNVRQAVDLITRFKQLGAKILLDDFGTGYSSLSYLHRLPIDYLKIDQSFVRRMTPDPASSGIVRAILFLAEGMGIETIAEGIETAEIASLLRELKCPYGQGYFYSKPLEPDAARRALTAPHGTSVPELPARVRTAQG